MNQTGKTSLVVIILFSLAFIIFGALLKANNTASNEGARIMVDSIAGIFSLFGWAIVIGLILGALALIGRFVGWW